MAVAAAAVLLTVLAAGFLVAIAVAVSQADRHDLALQHRTFLAVLVGRILGLYVRRPPRAGARQQPAAQERELNSGAPRR